MHALELISDTGSAPSRAIIKPDFRTGDADLPIVYSCSGCSSSAQLANDLALRLDRCGGAEMSCIAGVGGGVGSLVRLALSGRPIVSIDGCALKCCQACLDTIDVVPEVAIVLTKLGVPKIKRAHYDPAQADRIYAVVRREIEAMRASSRAVSNNGNPITPE